jgi:nicotinamidase-related amidase
VASKNEDLHGNAPDKAEVALLLIDVINDLEFPEGDQLLRHALPMAERLRDLKRRAREAGIPEPQRPGADAQDPQGRHPPVDRAGSQGTGQDDDRPLQATAAVDAAQPAGVRP